MLIPNPEIMDRKSGNNRGLARDLRTSEPAASTEVVATFPCEMSSAVAYNETIFVTLLRHENALNFKRILTTTIVDLTRYIHCTYIYNILKTCFSTIKDQIDVYYKVD